MGYFDIYKKTDTGRFIDNTLLKDKKFVNELDKLGVNYDDDNDWFLRIWNFVDLLRKGKTKEEIIDTFSGLSKKENEKAQGVGDLTDTYVLKYNNFSDFDDLEEENKIEYKEVKKAITKKRKYNKITKIIKYIFIVVVLLSLALSIYFIKILPKDALG